MHSTSCTSTAHCRVAAVLVMASCALVMYTVLPPPLYSTTSMYTPQLLTIPTADLLARWLPTPATHYSSVLLAPLLLAVLYVVIVLLGLGVRSTVPVLYIYLSFCKLSLRFPVKICPKESSTL